MNIEFINRLKKSGIFRFINLLLLIFSLMYLYDYYQKLDLVELYLYDLNTLTPIALLVLGNIINAFAWSFLMGYEKTNIQQVTIWMTSSIGKCYLLRLEYLF